ncbi:MAG: class I SAM-dependent methyltransferase [Desulfobacterales bacterium]|nr:class I SAM-dependent methyltransferase [Desulfobacterales bacterium]
MTQLTLETPCCRICGFNKGQRVRAEYVYGGSEEQKFWHCEACDAVYLFPPPSERKEACFYAEEFEKFMDGRAGSERDWTGARRHFNANQDQVRRRMPFLDDFLGEGLRLLEIGCSSGFMMEAFRKKGLQCTGVEPSGIFSEFLRSEGYEVFTRLGEVENNDSDRFDLVVSFFVLEHIRDPYDFIGRSLALLRDGGSFIAEVPCVYDPLTHLYDIPAFEKFYWSAAHHYYYSPKSLKFILDKMGLHYEMVADQRYDLSNHIVWMTEGKPGGQGKFNHIFSRELIEQYNRDLKASWFCDTIFLYIHK